MSWFRGPTGKVFERSGSEVVAIILAVGIATALNAITVAALWAALQTYSTPGGGLGENTTQVLTGWGGGILGVLGAYVGYTFGKKKESTGDDGEQTPPPSPRPPSAPQQGPGTGPPRQPTK